jgi:hypothetical protein
MAAQRATVGVEYATKEAIDDVKREGVTYDLFIRELLAAYIQHIENTEHDLHITKAGHSLIGVMTPPSEPLK